MKKALIIGGIVVAFIAVLIINPFVIVGAGERGIVLTWGAVDGKILNEGINWRTPIAQKIIKIDVRTQKEEVESAAATKDLQNVTAKVALNYHLDPSKTAIIYQTIGDNNAINGKILAPSLQESIKAVSSKFTAEELITKRESVRDEIVELIRLKLEPVGILVDGFNIVNLDFSASFNTAIEAKVTAEQNALAQKNKLEQVKYEAEQLVTTAKAQAESIRIQAAAVTSQGGADYVQLQAISKWNGILPAQMIPGSTVPFINLTK
jgi:regulator of protease activity HflC (stomatin/prohibitin superfamily)